MAGNLNFKLRIVFWNNSFLEILRSKNWIELSEKKPPLEAHVGFFRLLIKGIFCSYILWPLDKKLIFQLVTRIRTLDYTVYSIIKMNIILGNICYLWFDIRWGALLGRLTFISKVTLFYKIVLNLCRPSSRSIYKLHFFIYFFGGKIYLILYPRV